MRRRSFNITPPKLCSKLLLRTQDNKTTDVLFSNMSYRDDFNLFVGAEYGKFKGIKTTNGATIVKSIQSLSHLSKDSHITALAWSNDDEEEILIGLSNQTVKIYDTSSKVFCLSLDANFVSNNETCKGQICGLSRYNGVVVTAMESGHVRLLKCDENKANIYAGGPISKMRHCKTHPNIIGTGGLENELKLWDLDSGKNTFTAKNVPPDSLQLRVKVWVTDHVFMPCSDKVVVGSKYGYVRMYDPKAQRRPVMKVDIPEQAVTCITSSNEENTVLCGLAKGNIVSVDLRMGRTCKNYKGFVGAVKDIACHPTEPYIASVGLDRFVRVHHVTTKEMLVKEYVVSRMNCVLMRSNFSLKAPIPEPEKKAKKRGLSEELLSDGTSDHEEAQKFDEMFNSMEVVLDGSGRKSRPSNLLPVKNNSPKKRKSLGLRNPFASETSAPKNVKENPLSVKKKSESPEKHEDSDDDLMIVCENVGNPTRITEASEESEPDEAEGESDELDEDSDSQEEVNSNCVEGKIHQQTKVK